MPNKISAFFHVTIFFIRTRGSFLLNKLKTTLASEEEQSYKFSIKVVNKKQQVPHNSQTAFCFMLIHVQLQLPANFIIVYIVKPKATYRITRQASISARASVRYPV